MISRYSPIGPFPAVTRGFSASRRLGGCKNHAGSSHCDPASHARQAPPKDDDKTAIPEMIATSIEKNYAKLDCFIATRKIGHTYLKEILGHKPSAIIIHYSMDNNFKIIHETPDGKLTSSFTKHNDIFYQYVPETRTTIRP